MAKTVIRRRRAADMERCVRALRRVHELDDYPMVWPRDPVRWLSPAATYEAWVAERVDEDGAGELIGHVLLQRTASPATLEIARLFVEPAGRGLGLGAALLEAAGARAGADGYGLELEVVADERSHAIALYERTGWRRTGTVTAEWKRPDGGCVEVHRYVRG
jgi:GNAT superfamily N-acetyltransferase